MGRKRKSQQSLTSGSDEHLRKENIPPKPTMPKRVHSEADPTDSQINSRKKTQSSRDVPPPSLTSAHRTYANTSSSIDLSPLLSDFTSTHDITPMRIISSSHIEQKVSRVLELLSTYPVISPALPIVVLLHAKAAVASKMISIVEIAKREIGQSGGKWYQYTIVNSKLEEREEPSKLERKGMEDTEKVADRDVSMGAEGEEDGEGFEIMKTPFERTIEGKPKVRAVPVMAVYLSRVRIDSLRRTHGEQTNGLPLSQMDF